MTTVICGPRCSGRTTKLIGIVKEDPKAALIVLDWTVAKDITRKHPELKDRVLGIHTAQFYLCGRGLVRVYLDNIDYMEPEHVAALKAVIDIDGCSYSSNKELD